ncbi:hypothetical protein DY000_02059795 [Brassica cretica]|uniref:RNase H type-1 domain-containing protein n=1 Tax=Brassica cretica TaxID=69181 RepID=A0ABQ7B3H0_BRACR|nr:hypothetical protein DY000_02059795 [Brassica cretica]
MAGGVKWVRYGLQEIASKGSRECMDQFRIDVSEELLLKLGRYVATERNMRSPAKATRQLNVPSGGAVTTEFEYEKIHKRCFHCLRLTHEKIRCPLLRRGSLNEKQQASESHSGEKTHQNAGSAPPKANPSCKLLEGPPGFPPLFPELSKEEQKMAMLYISHADDTERRARIESKSDQLEEEAESSATNGGVFSAPVLASTDFQLGPSSGGRVSAITNGQKSQRKRPPVWKRRNGLRQHGAPLASTAHVPTPQLIAWILRDNKGKPTLHSRRSFSNVETKREAELMAIHWAVSDMINTRQQRILFESNCALAKETFLNPSGFYQHQHIIYETSSRLRHLQDWSFHHCVQERNILAQEVAKSVTNDHRYHSYIAAGGPSWLQHSIEREART